MKNAIRKSEKTARKTLKNDIKNIEKQFKQYKKL